MKPLLSDFAVRGRAAEAVGTSPSSHTAHG